MKVFFSGRPGSGKSAVFQKAVEILRTRGIEVRGIATPEVRDGSGARIGFDVVDLSTGARAVLSRVSRHRSGHPGVHPRDLDRRLEMAPRVGRYEVDVQSFESVAKRALGVPARGGIMAIDEVGKMEFFSGWFKELWRDLLNSETEILAVVGLSYLDECRGKGDILEVTMENRSTLPQLVAARFRR